MGNSHFHLHIFLYYLNFVKCGCYYLCIHKIEAYFKKEICTTKLCLGDFFRRDAKIKTSSVPVTEEGITTYTKCDIDSDSKKP
jgi:hypothetical protein